MLRTVDCPASWMRMCGASVVALLFVACGGDDSGPQPDQNGTVGGRVLFTLDGPLVGAEVSIDQLDYFSDTPKIRVHEGDTTTDATGHFEQLTGVDSGYFLITARGGQFVDYATGQTVVLDPADEIKTILYTDPLEDLTTGLVSPIGHLTQVLALSRLEAGMHPSIVEAHAFATEHIDRHFGDLPWERMRPADLSVRQTSPTAEVRAAFILGAWSLLAADTAAQAGSSVQEINPYTLAVDLGEDLATGPFDGNDSNDRTAGSGIQLGTCPPVDPCSLPDVACSLGACRSLCDAYAGSLRATLSAEVTKLINDNGPEGRNQTGLSIADTLAFARTMNLNGDAVLFGAACIEELDRLAPMLGFESPTPEPDAWVRQTIVFRARATDDVDQFPRVIWVEELADEDGAPNIAVATIDTRTGSDGFYTLTAEATDASGNSIRVPRRVNVDNTAPELSVLPAGFHVSGNDWWTATSAPVVTGTVTEDHLASVTAIVGGQLVGAPAAVDANGGWSLSLPVTAVPDTSPVSITFRATDLAGNVSDVVRILRYDAAGPLIAFTDRKVEDETTDLVNFSTVQDNNGAPLYDPHHNHQGIETTLGPMTACTLAAAPRVTKYAYLLDETSPAYVTEAGGEGIGAGQGGRNPIQWQFSLTDDGVGIDPTRTEYQVRDVTTGTAVLPWRSLPNGTIIPGGREYIVPVFRNGSSWPSIPSLGTADGHLYEISFRGQDLLGRQVDATRCWSMKLLASPIVIGARSTGGATSGNYDRYGFASLNLADTSPPIDPISMLLLNDMPGDAPGVGMMQFPVFNPTTEPVYLAFDFRPPASDKISYQRDEIVNRWGETSRTTVNTSCGSQVANPGPPVEYEPNYSLPGCNEVMLGAAGAGSSASASGAVSANYTIRVFEEIGSAMELAPCAPCAASSMPAPAADLQRVVVLVPPRTAPTPVAQSPRKFWVQVAIKTVTGFRPLNGGPPFMDISFIGGAVVAGKVIETRTGCSHFEPPTITPSGAWTCTRFSTSSRYVGLTRARLDLTTEIRVSIRPSRDGLAIEPAPAYFSQSGRAWQLGVTQPQATIWNSSEVLPPAF